MIFSSGIELLTCVECGDETRHTSSTSILYFLCLLAIGIAITGPMYIRAFGPEGLHRLVPIVMEFSILIGCILLWSAVSSLFRENLKACSKRAAQIFDLAGGFYHSPVPSLDDVGIGLMFAATQVGIGFAILRLGTSS